MEVEEGEAAKALKKRRKEGKKEKMSATNSYKVKLVLSIIEEHFGSVTKVLYL